jgi:hypothetical protein
MGMIYLIWIACIFTNARWNVWKALHRLLWVDHFFSVYHDTHFISDDGKQQDICSISSVWFAETGMWNFLSAWYVLCPSETNLLYLLLCFLHNAVMHSTILALDTRLKMEDTGTKRHRKSSSNPDWTKNASMVKIYSIWMATAELLSGSFQGHHLDCRRS